MSFLEILKKTIITNDSLKEPQFVKGFTLENKNILKLEELLKETTDENLSKNIESDIKRLSYGVAGESNVAYELKNSHMPILVLHDLYLEFKGLTAQVDFVVIAKNFILVIECKNLIGDIEINNKGEFIRIFKTSSGKVYKKEGMYSPIVQNQRHLELIKDILESEGFKRNTLEKNLEHISVVANKKAIINDKYAKADVKNSIIKYDQIINKMKEISSKNRKGCSFTEEKMYEISTILLKYNKEYEIDINEKYDLSNAYINEEETDVDVNEKESEEIETLNGNEEQNIENTEIYKELKKYRLDKSREENKKAFMLYTNTQLEEIVKMRPENLDELLKIKGFNKTKGEKYGDDIINIVRKYK